MSDQILKQLESKLAALQPTPAGVEPSAETHTPQSGPPTDDFNRCVLWHTWKYGPNGGQGEFRDWRITEGVRLTQIYDQGILDRIAELESPAGIAEWGAKDSERMIRILRLQLSYNYIVPPESRQHWHAFQIIRE